MFSIPLLNRLYKRPSLKTSPKMSVKSLSHLSTVPLRWARAGLERFTWLLPVGWVVGAALFVAGLSYVMVNISPILALLGLLAIPAGIMLITRPMLGLLLVVFAIPLEDFNELGGGLSVLKLLSIVVFGAAVVHFLVFRREEKLVGAPQNWLIALLLAAVVLSNFVAIVPTTTLERTFKFVRILSLYIVVINVVRTEKDLKSLVWVFLLSGFVCALYGCYSYYFNPALLSEDGRVTGTMDDPNEFTGAMVARLPLVLCLLRVEKRKMRRLLLIVGVGIVLFGIVRAESRGGFLALGLALVLFALCQKRRVTWLVIIGLIALVLLSTMPLSLQERLGMLLYEDQNLDSSLTRRMTYQIYGLQLFGKHPLLGVGISGFAEAYARSEYRFWQAGSVRRVAHNTYLEILVGTGLIGLLPFMTLLAASLFKTWKLANCGHCPPYLAGVSAGLFAGMGGYFLSCLFLSQQYEKTLWLLLAMVVVVQQLVGDRNHLVSLEDRGRL